MITPHRVIAVGDASYTLDGSFKTLRAVQHFFGKDIVQILIGVMDMPMDRVADLIAIGSGRPDTADAIGQAILDSAGAMSAEYALLKTELVAWLNVAVSPKEAREKKSAEMEGLLGAQRASLGKTTSGSPSAPSVGSPPNSGGATSGS